MSEQFEMIAKTFQGLEEILAEELTTLGANDIQIGRRQKFPCHIQINSYHSCIFYCLFSHLLLFSPVSRNSPR